MLWEKMPEPPEGFYLKLENFGRGWLAITLREKLTDESVMGRVINRPNPLFMNVSTDFRSESDSTRLHITQPNDVVNAARTVLQDYSNLENLSQNEKDYLDSMNQMYKEDYLKSSVDERYKGIDTSHTDFKKVRRLLENHFSETMIGSWLTGNNSDLQGRPIDFLRLGKFNEVQEALEAL